MFKVLILGSIFAFFNLTTLKAAEPSAANASRMGDAAEDSSNLEPFGVPYEWRTFPAQASKRFYKIVSEASGSESNKTLKNCGPKGCFIQLRSGSGCRVTGLVTGNYVYSCEFYAEAGDSKQIWLTFSGAKAEELYGWIAHAIPSKNDGYDSEYLWKHIDSYRFECFEDADLVATSCQVKVN